MLHHTDCNRLQQTATDCNRLQRIAMRTRHRLCLCATIDTPGTIYINSLQQNATDCNRDPPPTVSLYHNRYAWYQIYLHLQQTATDCNSLQQTATNCNVDPPPTVSLCHNRYAWEQIHYHTATDCNRLYCSATGACYCVFVPQ